ncbi:nuclease-related domain-containing DEAD/DEAH box helicase [Pectobacterium aroidearum]|uniref:nuclease-related domain-containing DEAD/DEAH box helicase n=1 Tax=Pectobacterium aroidearum TaxID=1201031 RepID=UPI002A826EEA|nr:NERD domain-containing protein [Pectobacterium aroidearum]MDY4388626.1 NERD domain-containing protein [Pectobacterium aroidearum]
MSILYPTLENIHRLKVAPTPGELHLLNYLVENLDDSYEIFFNPFIDGDRPDFIILKKNTAIFIIEVKDYSLANYSIDAFNKWQVNSGKGISRISSPQSQVFRYKSNLYNLHLPVLGLSYLKNRNFFNIVHPFVYLHKSEKSDIDTLYSCPQSELMMRSKYLDEQYRCNEISNDQYNQQADKNSKLKRKLSRDKSMTYGVDRIKDLVNKIKSIKPHILFEDRVYDDFKRRLMPSEHTLKQGKKIPLDERQTKLAISTSGKEKIKGVAGCGKTTIIANRAVNAFHRHDDIVLILTFNITLKNLIKDRISDILGYRDDQHFAVTNYHQFFNSQLTATEQDISELIKIYGMNALFKRDLFSGYVVNKYRTILIDEVQDFESEWVKIIRDNFLYAEGEMVLFGDESQNIYERDNKRAAIIAQGFGEWKKLRRSYRTNIDSPLNQIFKDYQLKYLFEKHSDAELFEQQNIQAGINFDIIKYHSCLSDWEEECLEKIQTYIRNYSFNPNDVVILSSNIFLIRRLNEKLNEFEKTTCMFETYEELFELLKGGKETPDINRLKRFQTEGLRDIINHNSDIKSEIERVRRAKKNHFYLNSGLIKLSTTHSFKGLESKTVFYIMDDKDTPEIIYTSITRTVENLIILDKSSGRNYAEFFRAINAD